VGHANPGAGGAARGAVTPAAGREAGGSTSAADPVAVGWTALRAFFIDGMPALEHAADAFRAAEPLVRSEGDPAHTSLWLLGLATTLRYSRRPEPMEIGLQRAREMVNLVARTQGEAAAVPYRTHVEGILRDLADVVPSAARAYVGTGLEYSVRTVRLARAARRDEWLSPALASRGDLLTRLAPLEDGPTIRRAVASHEEARRRWPARDRYGRAQAALGYADALLAPARRRPEPDRAVAIAREALPEFLTQRDRYHEAAARLLLARALAALNRSEALDEQAAAVALFRALGCRWEATRAEKVLA
jgi:hypothetical protein